MAERLKAAVSKTVIRVFPVSRVRIPPLPPLFLDSRRNHCTPDLKAWQLGLKFDPDGTYTKTFVPELKKSPAPYIFAPLKAPEDVLEAAGVKLDQTYPYPLAYLEAGRARALHTFETL